jgi:TolA-binding protein
VSEGDRAASRLLRTAEDHIAAKEHDRGVEILKNLIQQYPRSPVRYEAFLSLGKHYLDVHKETEGLGYLRQMRSLEKPGREIEGKMREIYLEALYLSGVAYFKMRQYSAAFPVLRKITTNYPNTVWANQAFYYIGMCHFARENWRKAIEALSLVGTFIDPDSSSTEYVEAGRRFYVKIEDGDLPVLSRLGEEIRVTVETESGDREEIHCIPLSAGGETYIGSIGSRIGPINRGDDTLQVIGGDTIRTTYYDGNTKEGEKDKPRRSKVRVVSTAGLSFTLGDFESRAEVAFHGQPLFVLLHDADKDAGAGRETIAVTVAARYKEVAEEPEAGSGIDIEKLLRAEEETYAIRDEVTIRLLEIGKAPVRSGRFGGSVRIEAVREGAGANKTDDVLTCALDDELVVTYVDELHIGGEVPRQVNAAVKVAGELESRPSATQYVVFDPIVKAKKNLVEGTAYLELGRIFSSMGLRKGAAEKCDLGLDLVESVVRSSTRRGSQIPSSLREEAFRLKWQLEICKEDYASAIATCRVFSRLFPSSPFVDQALLGIGTIKLEKKDFNGAIGVFRRIIGLRNSQAKAEAQFRIAETVEAAAKERAAEAARKGRRGPSGAEAADAAIPHYKVCAERYPDSEFAGPSLGKLIDYYIRTKDYAQADDLLEQIFQDYPDAQFLDRMLLKWVLVAHDRGNMAKAAEKCRQLIFEFPSSPFAGKARELLPKIEGRIEK